MTFQGKIYTFILIYLECISNCCAVLKIVDLEANFFLLSIII